MWDTAFGQIPTGRQRCRPINGPRRPRRRRLTTHVVLCLQCCCCGHRTHVRYLHVRCACSTSSAAQLPTAAYQMCVHVSTAARYIVQTLSHTVRPTRTSAIRTLSSQPNERKSNNRRVVGVVVGAASASRWTTGREWRTSKAARNKLATEGRAPKWLCCAHTFTTNWQTLFHFMPKHKLYIHHFTCPLDAVHINRVIRSRVS